MKIITDKQTLLPLTLSAGIIFLDQLTKALVTKFWLPNGVPMADFFNGFLQFHHVRNKAIAFSLGHNLPEFIKPVVFIVLPILVLGFLLWYYFSSPEFRTSQRLAMAGIIGGGVGNIIDRVFRTDGVVDFISIKFYGFLGMDRWPTFNIADSSVVVCCILLFILIIFFPAKEEQSKSQKKHE